MKKWLNHELFSSEAVADNTQEKLYLYTLDFHDTGKCLLEQKNEMIMWNNNYVKTKSWILLMLMLAFVWACNDISEKDSNGDYVCLYFTSEAMW